MLWLEPALWTLQQDTQKEDTNARSIKVTVVDMELKIKSKRDRLPGIHEKNGMSYQGHLSAT